MSRSDHHILILSSWYPTRERPFLGNFVERQAELLGTYYRVTVLFTEAVNDPNPTWEKREKEHFTEINVPYHGNTNVLARKRNAQKAFKQGLALLDHVDLIIGHVLLPKGWQFVLAKKQLNCPLFYIEHGSYFRENSSFRWSRVHRLIRARVSHHANEIIAVSEVLKKDLSMYFTQRDIQVIGNHIDTAVFHTQPKKGSDVTEFLHISTLDPSTKNPEGILDACALLQKETTDFRLTIVCDEDTSIWKTYAEELDISSCVRFVGPLDWHDLVPYYHAADAFVLFSDYETFSIVLIEALATGTPVITTPVGVAWKLDKQLGLTVEPGHPELLKQQMLRIVQGEAEFEQDQLVTFAQEFSAERILEQWKTSISKQLG